MKLTECLNEKSICTNLAATKRDEAIDELLSQLVAAGRLDEETKDDVAVAIIRREDLGSTAIGKGVAVPHARVAGLDEILMAVGLSEEGVDFRALDSAPVRAFFLVAGPEDAAEDYIALMGRVSELIQGDDFRRFLLRADSARDVLDLIEEMDA